MTLDTDQIERWARQIILPEVGGRGQVRLLETRVAVAGDGEAARAARDLLARAGIRVVGDADSAEVVVALVAPGQRLAHGPAVVGALGAHGVVVATLPGRPCAVCADVDVHAAAGRGAPPAALVPPLELALAALAAGEAVRVVLAPRSPGRVQTLDAASGRATACTIDATRGCARCGGDA